MEATTMNSAAFSWSPPLKWTCPRCGSETVTREPEPRCVVCGARDTVS